MQTIENGSLLTNGFVQDNKATSQTGHYEPVRYNAMTHGILSKHAVLPHDAFVNVSLEEMARKLEF